MSDGKETWATNGRSLAQDNPGGRAVVEAFCKGNFGKGRILPDDCSSKPANTESISHCGAIAIAASDSAKNGYP